jgi:hypothetical protein
MSKFNTIKHPTNSLSKLQTLHTQGNKIPKFQIPMATKLPLPNKQATEPHYSAPPKQMAREIWPL